MTQCIFIRIQTADRVDPDSIIAAIRRAYSLLQEIDSAVTNDPKGQVHWEIESISKKSPLEFAFVGRSKTDSNPIPRIQKRLTSGLKTVSKKSAERPADYSDQLLKSLRDFGQLQSRKDLGHISVFTSPTSKKLEISEKIVQTIGDWLEPTDESLGSIVGSLDSITVHRANEFRIWDEVNENPVTCSFDKDLLPKVKDCLKFRVLVSGSIRRNIQGLPVKIKVRDIERIKNESELPDIKEMAGLIDDFTGGKSLSLYLEEIRGEK